MNSNPGAATMPMDMPTALSMGVNAADVDRSVAQLQELSKRLLAERDQRTKSLRDLEEENRQLRVSLAALQEKWANYQPIIRQWGRDMLPPEEAEAIMKANKWISMDQFMAEVQQLIDRQ